MDKATLETLKEALRWALFYVISTGITGLIDYFTQVKDPTTTQLVIMALLRAADKAVHEYRKEKHSDEKRFEGKSLGILGKLSF